MTSHRALLVAALIATTPLFGCKIISAIIELPSDIIAGSSRSISGSFDAISTSSGSPPSEPTPNQTSFRRDLRAYTASFVRASGSREDFLRGVSRIAEDHGITHWESDAVTPRAIGEGLRDASFTEAEMQAFLDAAGRDTPAAQLALEGYLRAGG